MNIEIRNIPSRTVAAVRHTGPYDQCGAAWDKLCAWAGPRGLLQGSSTLLGLCHDDPEVTPVDQIRYDAGIVVASPTDLASPVEIREIPGGRYACLLHVGPFATLKHAYQLLLGEWLPSTGHCVQDAPSVEVYLDDPKRVAPEKLRVEIQVLLAD